jgi:hypothetical protein
LIFTVADGEEIPIGVVDHIEEANAALISLETTKTQCQCCKKIS